MKGSFRVTGSIAAEAVELGSEDTASTSAAAMYDSSLKQPNAIQTVSSGVMRTTTVKDDSRLHY